MNIDDLGRSTAADLHAQMEPYTLVAPERFGETTVDDRRRRVTTMALTALVLVLAAVGVGSLLTKQRTVPAGPPPGVTPQHLRTSLGFSVDLPATWDESTLSQKAQFAYYDPDGTASISAGVGLDLPGVDGVEPSLDTVADHFLKTFTVSVQIGSRRHVRLDGKPAVEVRYSFRSQRPPTVGLLIHDTMYIVRSSSGYAIQLTVQTGEPRADARLLDWIVSTIRIS